MADSTSSLRRGLLVSTCLTIATLGSPLAARASEAAAVDASAPVSAPSQVGEVVVTAERRSVNLQKAPLSISAVGGQSLDQSFITDLTGLDGHVPGLQVAAGVEGEDLITIRGVGSETPEEFEVTTPGVSIFIDGVYSPNSISFSSTLFDVADIEVLRGPQGALYGQSSIGGAILINTKQPVLHEFSGSGDFSAGTYTLFRERAEVNVPLGEQWAFRGSLQRFDHDGFSKDVAIPDFSESDAHDTAAKAALLWKPSPRFSATLTGMVYNASEHGPAQKNVNDPESDPWTITQDYPGHFGTTTQLYHLNLQYDASAYSIKSVTGYQVINLLERNDSSRSSFNLLGFYDDNAEIKETAHNFTEEFDVLSRPGAKFDWILGAFYLNQRSHQVVVEYGGETQPSATDLAVPPDVTSVLPANTSYGNYSHGLRESYSIFGQATFHLLDRLRLTAGARLNLDGVRNPGFNFFGFGIIPSDAHSWDRVPTWRVEADYDLTPANLLYASIGHGYKPSGVNGTNGQVLIPVVFKLETNTSFEVGAKNYFFDRALRLNVSAFYAEHKNFQYIEADPVPFDDGISNVPSIHDYGLEVEASYVGLNHRLHLDASLAYERGQVASNYNVLDETVTEALIGQPPSFPGVTGTPCEYYAAYGGSPTTAACYAAILASAKNVKGDTPPGLPEYSGSLSASYMVDVPTGTLTPRVEYVYRGTEWARIFNVKGLDSVPAYGSTNLNIDYVPTNNSKLRLTLTATNIFNVAGINSRYIDPFGSYQSSNVYIPPAQVIGTIAYAF